MVFLNGIAKHVVSTMTEVKSVAVTPNAGQDSSARMRKKRKGGAMETELLNFVWAEFFQLPHTQSSNPLTCPNCGGPVKLSRKRKANWVIKDGKDKYICSDKCRIKAGH